MCLSWAKATYVRPLALYPLVLLWPVLLIRLKQGKIAHPWPGALTVLLAFVLAALAATSLGATLSPLELRGVEYSDRAIRALLTLAIGVSFFVAAIWMNQSEEELKVFSPVAPGWPGIRPALERSTVYWTQQRLSPATGRNPESILGARAGPKQARFRFCL